MELPAEVLIHNDQLNMKGTQGRLLTVAEPGYYEIDCKFGEKVHRVLLPIARTALIHKDPEPPQEENLEIER